jgi:hypothetical protein
VDSFEYGIAARATFIGLLWLTVLIGFTAPNLLPWHIGLLLFLAFGLKPLLLKTGLYHGWLRFLVKSEQVRYAKFDAAAAEKVERRRRDDKLRKARKQSTELPPNW